MNRANLLKSQQKVLKHLREQKGYSISEVALKLNYNTSIYSRLENGKIALNLFYVFAISELYGLTGADLLNLLNGKEAESVRRRDAFVKTIERLLEENERLRDELGKFK